jgi:hypothetical protein
MVAIKNRKKIGAIKANSIAAEPDTERNAEKCEAVFRNIARPIKEPERHAEKCADVARMREAASFRRLFARTRIFIMNCDTGFPIRLLTEVRH